MLIYVVYASVCKTHVARVNKKKTGAPGYIRIFLRVLSSDVITSYKTTSLCVLFLLPSRHLETRVLLIIIRDTQTHPLARVTTAG